MKKTCLLIIVVICTLVTSVAQSDSEPTLCDGMPASQMAYAQLLGLGKLEGLAHDALLTMGVTDADALLHSLFTPPPTSLLALNGRIDLVVGSRDVALANKIRSDINGAVASLFISIHQTNPIACSISLLSFREASDVFGKRIATQYGVVQVTIRNTDPDHEFLLHQIDFWFGDTLQYFATRDRKIARGVAEKGQAIDPRNIAVRILETVGNIAAASTIPFAGDPQIGSSVFNSAFIPGIKYIFPDLTVPQIAKLDDMGFSAGAGSMLIPKSGAISVVAFIPADTVMVPKLAQYDQFMSDGGSNRQMELDQCHQLAIDLQKKEKNSTDSIVHDQIAKCGELMGLNVHAPPPLSPESLKGAESQKRPMHMLFKRGTKNIGNFDPAVALLLQRDLHILVSGAHIQQVPVQANINSMSCTPNPSGPLLQGSTVECVADGAHLDLIMQAQLVGKTQSIETITASSITAAKADGTEIKIVFAGCSFTGKLSTDYILQITNSRNVQMMIPISQHVDSVPSLVCLPAAASVFQCGLQNLPNSVGSKVTLAPIPGNGTDQSTLVPTPPATTPLSSGTYSVTVKTADGRTLNLCSAVRVP